MRAGIGRPAAPSGLLVALTLLVCGIALGSAIAIGLLARSPDVPGLRDYQALAHYNGFSIVRANGPSMEPTYARWNFLLVRDIRRVHRGDVLVSGRHGIHRVVALPGETVWLAHGRVHVCTPAPRAAPACRSLREPYVAYTAPRAEAGPVTVRDGYITVPDNRACCAALIAVPAGDIVGIVVGSLLSYGPLGPAGVAHPAVPAAPTLRYER